MNGKYERPLRYIMFAGLILAALAIIFMAPWSDKLGVSGSPQRTLLLWIYAVVGALPLAIYFMYKFSLHPEWNTMPGRFVEGMKVKTYSPYTYVAIGVVAIGGITVGLLALGGLAPRDLQPQGRVAPPREVLPRRASATFRSGDPARARLFDPAFRAAGEWASRLRRYQAGRLNLQLLYTVATLLALAGPAAAR